MYYKNLILIPALLCAAAAFGQGTPKPAHADIINPQGQKIGTAKIFAAREGVNIELNASQLPPGIHGVHIHNVGKCDGADFTSAGPHLNPYTKKHGKDNPEGPHAGDLLNLEVNAGGIAKATLLDNMVTLSDGPNSIFHDDRDPRQKRTITKPIRRGTPDRESPAALFRNRGIGEP